VYVTISSVNCVVLCFVGLHELILGCVGLFQVRLGWLCWFVLGCLKLG
jgi:TM2 domain-containing membrane protein YozV